MAYNSQHLSVYFRDYYAEYQVIKECTALAKLARAVTDGLQADVVTLALHPA